MKVEPNSYGFITLIAGKDKSESMFLDNLYKKGHILIVAKAIKTERGNKILILGESIKRAWRAPTPKKGKV